MAAATSTAGSQTALTTWTLTDGNWSVADKGSFDQSSCGFVDPRDDLYFFATSGKTIASMGDVNWQPTSNGWECAGGPSIAIAAGHSVFVGNGGTSVQDPTDSFWRSDDGVVWQSVQDSPTFMRIVAVKDGFVAVGTAGYGPVDALFTSTDGKVWTSEEIPFGDQYLERLASDGTRAVMLEDSDQPGTKAPGAIWISSTNGVDWTRYQLPPRNGDYADQVAIVGNRVLATGTDAGGTHLVWTKTIQ